MAQFNFDTQTVEKRESFELLPAGWYTAQVTESEIVPLKSGNGSALKLTFEVIQEGYRNRKVWARLNVKHSNPETERIAQQQLRELCDSIGVARMTDTVMLHKKPVQIKVKIRKDDSGQYEDQNEINGFKPVIGGATATAAGFPPIRTAPTASVPPAAAAPAAAAPPWAKKAA